MKLFCRKAGNEKGPAIVLLHAFPLSSQMWSPQFDALKDWNVYAPDLRGFGNSPLQSPWMIDHAVDDVLESVPDPTAVYVGLSMGGYVALRLYEKAAHRVRALVLCDTRAEADTNEGKLKRSAAINFIRSHGVGPFATPFLKEALSAKVIHENTSLIDSLTKMAVSSSPEAVMAALMALASRGDQSQMLKSIKVPTAIMVGESDKITPLALSQSLQSNIPMATLDIIANAGHFSNLENSIQFNMYLTQFLSRIG